MPDGQIEPGAVAERPIPFIDLGAQRERIADRINAAVSRVIEHGGYILGPEVRTLEEQLAQFVGTRHSVTCGSGTEALLLPLLALGVGPGSAILCPSFTFAATAEVIALTGATPIFLDVKLDTFNIDAECIERAVDLAKNEGLTPAGIIPVDLFGQTAEYDAIAEYADRYNLFVIEDAAQSLGATYHGKSAGSFGIFAATSFFPAKPLGCYGDGGAVFTNDETAADALRSLRVHGQGSNKYENVRIGINGRMDTIQAAIVLEKLKIFPDEIIARRKIAERYSKSLSGAVSVPFVADGMDSVWAQYTILLDNRQHVADVLKSNGVPTAIYYPKPLHLQPAYAGYPRMPGGLPVSEQLSDRVLSLPFHPYLDEPTQDRIIDAVLAAV